MTSALPGWDGPAVVVEVPAALVDWVDSLAAIATVDNPVEAIAIAHAASRGSTLFSTAMGAPAGFLEPAPGPPRLPPGRHLHPRPQPYLRAFQRADAGDPGRSGSLSHEPSPTTSTASSSPP